MEPFDQSLFSQRVGVVTLLADLVPAAAANLLFESTAGRFKQGVALGTVNSNTFQDDDYKLGGLTHVDAKIRQKAIDHHFECLEVMAATGSRDLKIWLADGSNYPGQADLRGRQDRLADSLATAALRLVMAPFAHSLFTTLFALGVWFALHRRSTIAKIGCIVAGYVGAVLLHAMWNGSALLGPQGYFAVYVLWMMPVFGATVALALHNRRREQRIVAAKLPGMVAAGVVTANEASWLGTIATRKKAIAEATRFGGKPAGESVKRFAQQVVELAFVRDRIDRGFGDHRVAALLVDETYAVYAARAASPALRQMAGYHAGLQLPGSQPPRR